MRLLALGFLALAATSATAQRSPADTPPQTREVISKIDEARNRNCDDRITQVRAANRLPKLDRGTASSDDAYFIAAVDHSIDGCAVMVMREDTSDIRPLPAPSEDVRIHKVENFPRD